MLHRRARSGQKFESCQAIPALREYVLVHHDRMRVEHYSRGEGNDEWLLRVVTDPEASVRFPSLGCEIVLSEIYAKVELTVDNRALLEELGDASR